jgi:hypothetical protein
MYRLHFRRQSVNIRVKGESRCDERPYHHDSICRLEDIHVILDSFQILNVVDVLCSESWPSKNQKKRKKECESWMYI